MTEFYAVMLITILAVISPGADFAIVTKNSYMYGRSVGVLTAIGIALGVLIHVAYTLIGVKVVMHLAPNFLVIIKYVGALYLIYIGYKTFLQRPVVDTTNKASIGLWRAFRNGFFTNALNPKTTLFVISTYTQIVSATTSNTILIGYGIFMSAAHFIWFTVVALLFSQQALRTKMLRKQVVINRVIGSILALLGMILLMTNIQ
ncbi:LysE family translocator [Psychrobacter sp. T6-5]|uniref:LysE family translocator n=1 Tax=Psychrobacter sp. T6-5 TaxID=3457451 RepID=UPI003FD57365